MSMTNPAPAYRRRRPALLQGTPLISVAMGLVMGGAAWIGGQPGFAVFAFLLMLAVAIALVLASPHSETVNGLLNGQDERISAINRDASGIAGTAVIWAVLAGFVFELVAKGNTQPYVWPGAIGGVTYLIAVITLRIRR